jgi:hypothetical protein
MACPDCGCPSGEFRFATSIETHGLDCGPFERFDEEFIVCGGCGGRFDPRDWEETEDVSYSMMESVDSFDKGNNTFASELEMPEVAGSASAMPFAAPAATTAAEAAAYVHGRPFNVQTGSEDTL